MSNRFKPSATFDGSDNLDIKGSGGARLFQMHELAEGAIDKDRSFSYQSETARNFDQANVNKAKEGVKELMADAISKAKTKAIQIKDDARQEGYKTGYDAGFQKGEDAAKEEFSPFLETLHNLIHDLSQFRQLMYPKAEKEMIEMVVGLTKKVLQHEMDLREDSVQQMILLAMNSVLDKENMVIRIHPTDKGHAETFRPELHNMFGEIKNITFEAHSGIERGGCVIESNFGTVDARVNQMEEQIENIMKLTPAIPEIKSSGKILPEEHSETESEETPESVSEDSENIKNTLETETDETPETKPEDIPEDSENIKNALETEIGETPETKPEDIPEGDEEDFESLEDLPDLNGDDENPFPS